MYFFQQESPKKSEILGILTDLVADPEKCSDVLSCFKPVIAELVGRVIPELISHDDDIVQGSFAISKLLLECPYLIDLTEKLFLELKSISQQKELTDTETQMLMKVYRNLVLADAGKFFMYINWTLVIRGLIIGNHDALRCLSIIAQVADLSRLSPRDAPSPFQKDYFDPCVLEAESFASFDGEPLLGGHSELGRVMFDAGDIRTNLVPMAGILLSKPKSISRQYSINSTFIVTQSLSAAVKGLTFSLATKTPIIIEGELGTGKTSLLEYFAAMMGRNESSGILKLQLGDQTDSKVLYGR